MSLFDMLMPLGVVAGLLGMCWWLLRRTLAPTRGGGRPGLRVLQRVHLTPRQGVAVVEVHGVHRLISWGEGGARSLGDVPPPPAATESISEIEGPRGEFLRGLSRAFGRSVAPTLLLACLLFPSGLAAQQSAPRGAPTAPVVTAPAAPSVRLQVGQGDGALNLSGSVGTAVFLGLLSLLPAAIMVMTSFTRFVVVLGFLRSALGTQTAPPTQILVILAVLLTGVVMRPTLDQVSREAVMPYLEGTLPAAQAYEKGTAPLKRFMLANVRDRDLALFAELSHSENAARAEDLPLVAVTGAFLTSELRTAFLMGFLLFVPFLVIDLIVSSVLMSLGMFMLPPVMVSLPFKLLLFVLADGWVLLVRSLVSSYQVVGG